MSRFRSGLWPQHASAPSSDTPLSGGLSLSRTPPSHLPAKPGSSLPQILPEFLPVLDQASTLKAPLVLPPSSYLGAAASSCPPPAAATAPALRSAVHVTIWPMHVPFYRGPASQESYAGSDSGSSAGGRRPGPGHGQGPRGALVAWVPHLMVFSLLCLVMTVATVAFTVSVVDDYDRTATGTFFQISDIHWDPLYRSGPAPAPARTSRPVQPAKSEVQRTLPVM